MCVQSNSHPYKLVQPGPTSSHVPAFPTTAEPVTVAKNLYHHVIRVRLSESPVICTNSVLLDTYPVAIPVDLLAKEDLDMVVANHQTFRSPESKQQFTLNPAFCLKLVAQALTSGGKGKLGDIYDGQVLTCG